jgi:hypothetical protein
MPKRKFRGIKKLPPRLKTTPQGILALPPEDSKTIKFDNKKYVRISETESQEKFRELGERVSRKELKWIYYTIENNVGTHYYLILNVKQ